MFELKVFADPAELETGQHQLAVGEDSEAAADFTSALALWQEDPLRDAAGWSFTRRALVRLHAQRRIARIGLAEIRFSAGRQREVIGDLQKLTADSPGQSQAWELPQGAVLTGSLSR